MDSATIFFLYHNYRSTLFATALYALVTLSAFTQNAALTIFLSIVGIPTPGEFISELRSANRRAVKYFAVQDYTMHCKHSKDATPESIWN
ncbi:hypothetical protein AQJ66_36525 [Streptomyces bungoensis]|uniref:Uncharacterized protein n=1 Tax=Streptomyces bungoensis TaxID=285568 RepID=A0A117R7E6_9ACTN|nr:hypothetical protein [Streptomyces bungoensis]KUN75028.1 hypothetical protein AQJ66_36525 [Streptomyces bungoensis]